MIFSVITINYNNCNGLRRTMESVVGQTLSAANYEYIVIDGGSTDGSVDVVRGYNGQVAYWVSEPDRGIYHAMNKGVAKAHGDYCIFMNSGDVFYDSTVLEHMAARVLKADILVGRTVSAKDGTQLFAPPAHELSLYYFYSGTLPHQSSFIRTELLRQHPYDETLRIVSDWKFFLQAVVMDSCTVEFVDERVALFDMDGVSTSNPQAMWNEKEQVLTGLFPPRVLADYQQMKQSECLTQTLTPCLRKNYGIDRLLYYLGKMLLKLRGCHYE